MVVVKEKISAQGVLPFFRMALCKMEKFYWGVYGESNTSLVRGMPGKLLRSCGHEAFYPLFAAVFLLFRSRPQCRRNLPLQVTIIS